MQYTNEFKYYYWGPCLTRFSINDELCDGLLQRGSLLKEDARAGLAGHLDKELKYTREDKDWFLSKFSPVISDHMKYLNEYHNKDIQVNIELTDYHKYYICSDSAGPGCIKFINDMNSDKLNIAEVPIFPKEKECYIFPGTLMHMVSPFKSDCERVSVSGNFKFIKK